MCRANHIPVAYICEELQSQPDRRKYLADDGMHRANDGFEMASSAWREAMDQVNFAVLDRAD
jgi:lipopolysaccharide biosynthesis protein